MKTSRFQLLAVSAVSFLIAGSFLVASMLKPARNDRKTSESREQELRGEKSPPEDWFVTQRVTHGGIPAGALRKAGEQAAGLRQALGQSDSVAATRWRFVGPTNIGGR